MVAHLSEFRGIMIDEGGASNTAPHLTDYTKDSRAMATTSLTQISLEKTCIHCGRLLPITEFYFSAHGGDNHNPYCKECARAIRIKNYSPDKQRRERAIHHGEAILIAYLRSNGVYAAPGKCSEWRWIDVVAFGCVRIECKYSEGQHKEHFAFAFGYRQRNVGISADVVALICDDGIEPTFHLFDIRDAVFDGIRAKTKRSLSFIRNPKSVKGGRKTSILNTTNMAAARDNISVIYDYVGVAQRRLTTGDWK